MNSPFKFLWMLNNSGGQRLFFRPRCGNRNALYPDIQKPHVAGYGQSGTGKTSLIQCGLGGRFDDTDWYPFLLRRNHDINRSLAEAISAPLGGALHKGNIPDTIAQLYKTYLLLIYLIFDQMGGSFFILGTAKEQEEFIQTIKSILAADLPCKIILVMREEYIAHLYYFEQVIPTLFDHRLRVEPMNYANVAKVITGSCEKFNIELESPEETNLIIDQISVGKSGVELPDFASVPGIAFGRLITIIPILAAVRLQMPPPVPENTLRCNSPPRKSRNWATLRTCWKNFCALRRSRCKKNWEAANPGLPDYAVRQVLDLFVTEDGTKRPVPYVRQDGQVVLEENQAAKLALLPLPVVREILDRLEKVRILRFTENLIELAHDSLADLIYRDWSTEQRQINLVKQRLNAGFGGVPGVESRSTDRQLAGIEPYLPQTHWSHN